MPEPVALDSCELNLVDPERVRSVQATLPEADVVDKLAEVFGLLSIRTACAYWSACWRAESCACATSPPLPGWPSRPPPTPLRPLRAHHVVKAGGPGE